MQRNPVTTASAPSIPFATLELALQLVRTLPFHLLHQLTHRNLGWNAHQHVDVILRYHPAQHFYFQFTAFLSGYGPKPHRGDGLM
jgi:hypothetical protein